MGAPETKRERNGVSMGNLGGRRRRELGRGAEGSNEGEKGQGGKGKLEKERETMPAKIKKKNMRRKEMEEEG